MPPHKLITISLPPPLLKQAEALAREENRTKSDLVREAVRFYVETRGVRKQTTRGRLGPLVERVQARTKRIPASEIRKAIRDAIKTVRREVRRSTA
jgi:metal-responsive CopG/Arc/MetJ family transcriptional regulator